MNCDFAYNVRRKRNFWQKTKIYPAANYFRRGKFMYRVASVYVFMLLYLLACNSSSANGLLHSFKLRTSVILVYRIVVDIMV